MDIATANATVERENDGAILPLLDRNGEPDLDSNGKQSTLTIVGKYSKKVGKTEDTHTRKAWKRRPGSFDPADITRKNRIERAASAITSWSGIENNKEAVPYSHENAVALLTAAPWILDQVENAIEEYASFFGKPSSN